jgi:hypothetical protein
MKCLAPVLPAVLIVLLPCIASAQSSDMKYCRALIETFREVESSNTPNLDIPMAMAKCEQGDTAAGIPVLENALRARRATLPSRE